MSDPAAIVRRYGAELVAYIAAWLTVDDGRVREHETFDCYEPLPVNAR